MEDRLIRAEACDDETEYNLMVLGSRIALNLCMLATFRLTELTSLPPRVQRHRRLRDPRLNRLAARHCQEVLFKDLFIRERPHEEQALEKSPLRSRTVRKIRSHVVLVCTRLLKKWCHSVR